MSIENAELLRDKNGDLIPQYYDGTDGVFKPLTKDNYPDIQDVRVTNRKNSLDINNFPESFEISNIPKVQKVEDETVKQAIESIPQFELPSTVDTHDSKLMDMVQELKNNVNKIDTGLNDVRERMDQEFDTRVTGSNVEDGIPVKQAGTIVEDLIYFESGTDKIGMGEKFTIMEEIDLTRYTHIQLLGRTRDRGIYELAMTYEDRNLTVYTDSIHIDNGIFLSHEFKTKGIKGSLVFSVKSSDGSGDSTDIMRMRVVGVRK